MTQLTSQRLARRADAAALDRLLGPTLSALMRADGRPQAWPCQTGLALVLVAWHQPPSDLFAPGFILPVRWQSASSGQTHDARLPHGLRALADEVLAALLPAERRRDYRLALGLDLRCDLSALDAQSRWRSAWTSLAASLLLTTRGGQPDPHVLASADYDPALGVRGVGALEHKLGALARCQAPRLTLFVAPSDLDAARQAAARHPGLTPRLTLRAYALRDEPQGALDVARDVERALCAHLDALAVLPIGDPERLLHWLNQGFASTQTRDASYLDVVALLAARLSARSGSPQAHTVVTAVGDRSFQQAALLALTLRPARMIVAWSGRSSPQAQALRQWLGQQAPHLMVELHPLPEPPSRQATQALVERVRRLAPDSPEDVIVDVTSGTRAMIWALMEAARVCGARISYLQHSTLARRADQPHLGQEALIFYDQTVSLEASPS